MILLDSFNITISNLFFQWMALNNSIYSDDGILNQATKKKQCDGDINSLARQTLPGYKSCCCVSLIVEIKCDRKGLSIMMSLMN